MRAIAHWNHPPALDYAAASIAMTRSTAIMIHVPSTLRDHCGGATDLSLTGASVRAILVEIEQRHPLLHRSLCDETGAVRRHIGVFVNRAHVRDREGLETVLVPGDIVTFLPAVSGG